MKPLIPLPSSFDPKAADVASCGYAVITNHPFRESEAWRLLPLVGKVTDS